MSEIEANKSDEKGCVGEEKERKGCPCGHRGPQGVPGVIEGGADCVSFYSYPGQCPQGGDNGCGQG